MARSELDRVVQASLLDRLTDESPSDRTDQSLTREASTRVFRASVQRDVEALLNTRRTIVRPTEHQQQVTRSVHQFGLPDMTSYSLSAVDGRERLREVILDTLRRFEPRLTDLQVHLADQASGHVSQLRFSIAATLLMDPSPEHVVFDTVLDVATGAYDVDDRS